MASASTIASNGAEECNVCSELLKNPRVLDCDHVFCLPCLERLERNKRIECPFCKHITEIPLGMQVKHLSKVVRGKKRAREGLKVIHSWKVPKPISSVALDDERKLIYVGQWPSNSILVYTFKGRHVDTISGSGLEMAPRLTLDSKRGILVCGSGVSLRSYNETGTRVGFVDKTRLGYISDIAYLTGKDRFVIPDHVTHRIHFYTPVTEKVVRSVAAVEARATTVGGKNVSVATPKTSDYSMIATADSERSLVKLYDGEGNFIRRYGGVGTGFGKMNRIDGISFDYEGRILVSDRKNQRIIRISPDAVDENKEWEVVMNTEKLGVGLPRNIEITSDGFIVMSSFTSATEGPFHITVLGGYQ